MNYIYDAKLVFSPLLFLIAVSISASESMSVSVRPSMDLASCQSLGSIGLFYEKSFFLFSGAGLSASLWWL